MTELFSLRMARSTTKRSLSGKFILHYIFFYNDKHDESLCHNETEWLNRSVFTDDYINLRQESDKQITESELLYYIMFLQTAVPKNLAPKLSNLVQKTASTTGQPPEIRELLLHIDLQKLRTHLEGYGSKTAVQDEHLTNQLTEYIHAVLSAEPRLQGVCHAYHCTLYEQLAWMILYALADRDCFDRYENAYRIELQTKTALTQNQNTDTQGNADPLKKHALPAHAKQIDENPVPLTQTENPNQTGDSKQNVQEIVEISDEKNSKLTAAVPDTPIPLEKKENHDLDTVISTPDSESVKQLRERISAKYRSVSTLCSLSIRLLFVLLSAQIITMVIPISIWGLHDTSGKKTLFYICMLSFSIVILLLRFIPMNLAKQKSRLKVILDHYDSDPYLQKYALIENIPITSIHFNMFRDTCYYHTELEKNRKVLNAGVAISISGNFIISLLQQSFPLMTAGVALTMLIYMWIDVTIMNHRYASAYNRLDERELLPGTEPVSGGFGKMYSWDFDTGIHSFRHPRILPSDLHSASCIRYIFLAYVDRLSNNWTIITVLLFLLNFIMLIAGIVEYMLPFNYYFRLPTPEFYSAFSLILIISMGIVNITTLLWTEDHYDRLTLFAYLPGAAYADDRELIETYQRYRNNQTITDLDVNRGIYKYNCTYIEQGKTITEIFPETDRIIFPHRQSSRISRTALAVWISCLIIVSIVTWHFHILMGLLAIPVAFISNILFLVWILPAMDFRKIRTVIEKNGLA